MWLPKILLVILSSWRLEGKNVLSEQKPVDEKYPPPPPAPVLPDPAAPPKLSAMDIESMKAWGMTDKQIQDALAFSSKAVDEEEEASLSMLVNLLSEQELNSITEMSETEMAEFFRELAEDRRLRSAQNTSITDHSEQRGRVRQLLFAFIKDPPSQKRRRRQAENPSVTLLQKTKLYEESKKAREPTLSQFEIKTMANSMKSTLGRIQGIVDREKQHRHERRRRAAEEPASVPGHSSATGQAGGSPPRSIFPPPTSFKPSPLIRMARSLFHDDAQEVEERVVPTYHVPDFVPSPQFLSETINVRERRSTDVLIDEDMLKDVYSSFDFHSLDEQQDEAWSLQSAFTNLWHYAEELSGGLKDPHIKLVQCLLAKVEADYQHHLDKLKTKRLVKLFKISQTHPEHYDVKKALFRKKFAHLKQHYRKKIELLKSLLEHFGEH